jgi:hypothetical protein
MQLARKTDYLHCTSTDGLSRDRSPLCGETRPSSLADTVEMRSHSPLQLPASPHARPLGCVLPAWAACEEARIQGGPGVRTRLTGRLEKPVSMLELRNTFRTLTNGERASTDSNSILKLYASTQSTREIHTPAVLSLAPAGDISWSQQGTRYSVLFTDSIWARQTFQRIATFVDNLITFIVGAKLTYKDVKGSCRCLLRGANPALFHDGQIL